MRTVDKNETKVGILTLATSTDGVHVDVGKERGEFDSSSLALSFRSKL